MNTPKSKNGIIKNGMSMLVGFDSEADEHQFFTLKRYLPDPMEAQRICINHLTRREVLDEKINIRRPNEYVLSERCRVWVRSNIERLSEKYEFDVGLFNDYQLAAICALENSEMGDLTWFAGAALFSFEQSKSSEPNASEFSFDFGFFISEFIQKSRNERDYNRGIKTGPKAGSAGGKAKDKEYNEAKREERFFEMEKHINDGHSVNRAAQLCEKKGLGSADAIRKQWQNHRK